MAPRAPRLPQPKAQALLERIIQASCNEGDVVLAPFRGCENGLGRRPKLKQRWLGIDTTHLPATLMKNRLMTAAAISPGLHHSEIWQRNCPELQIHTIEAWLDGKGFDIPYHPTIIPPHVPALEPPHPHRGQAGAMSGPCCAVSLRTMNIVDQMAHLNNETSLPPRHPLEGQEASRRAR